MADVDMDRLDLAKGHPNAQVTDKDIDSWVSRIEDVSSAVNDFLQSDPEEYERRRQARRAEIAKKDQERKKQQTIQRYDTKYYRRFEDDKFIDDLLAEADKPAAAVSESEKAKQFAAERNNVSKENQMTDFERIALEEALQTRTRANGLVQQGKYNEAHELYSTIITLNPDDDALILAARNNRALTSLRLQPTANYTQAVEDASFVIKHDTRNVKARLRRASALSALHRPKEAIADLKVVLRCDSTLRDAQQLLLAAQREVEETEAADKTSEEDDASVEKFVKEVDQVEVTCEALGKLLSIEKPVQVEGSVAAVHRAADSDVAKASRSILEHLVAVSDLVNLDDGFVALFRLRDGFQKVGKVVSVLHRELFTMTAQPSPSSSSSLLSSTTARTTVPEVYLTLAAAFRVLSSALSVERTAAAFGASDNFKQMKELLRIAVDIVDQVTVQKNAKPSSNFEEASLTRMRVTVAGASLSLISQIIPPSLVPWESSLEGEQKSILISSVIQTVFALPASSSARNNNNNNNNNNSSTSVSPLQSDGMLLAASIMNTESGFQQLTAKRSPSEISNVVFSAVESCSTLEDFSSQRTKAIAMLLLRISTRQQFSKDIASNLPTLAKLLAAILSKTGSSQKKGSLSSSSASSSSALSPKIRYGILTEAVLSAIHNAVVLGAIDKSTLAEALVGSLPKAASSTPSWISGAFLPFLSSNISDCITQYSSVVSKCLALLSKCIQVAPATTSSRSIAKAFLCACPLSDHNKTTTTTNNCGNEGDEAASRTLKHPLKILASLCFNCLSFVNEQRGAKARALADADSSSLEVVSNAANLWVATSLQQSNLLENITLIVAALIQYSSEISPGALGDSNNTGGGAGDRGGDDNDDNIGDGELARLAFALVQQSASLPRVGGNAANWIAQRLAVRPLAQHALKKIGAKKVIETLFAAIKDISAQIYDAERKANSTNQPGNSEAGASASSTIAMLKGARKNIAVSVAKLCAIPEGGFVEEFREQRGAELFSGLKLA